MGQKRSLSSGCWWWKRERRRKEVVGGKNRRGEKETDPEEPEEPEEDPKNHTFFFIIPSLQAAADSEAEQNNRSHVQSDYSVYSLIHLCNEVLLPIMYSVQRTPYSALLVFCYGLVIQANPEITTSTASINSMQIKPNHSRPNPAKTLLKAAVPDDLSFSLPSGCPSAIPVSHTNLAPISGETQG